MNSFFSSIVNRVRSYKEEDLREFISRKSRIDDVVVSHYLENQDKFNLSDSLKIGDKELEKIADELSQRFNSVFKLDTKDSDKILSALLERKEIDVKLSDDVDLKITRRLKNGFTLIELMITVAIVGVLGSVAIPSYQDYVARSQVAEGLSLLSGSKIEVGEYFANNGNLPNFLQTRNLGSYIDELYIEDRLIKATLSLSSSSKIVGGYIALEINDESNNITFNCVSDLDKKYLPAGCNSLSVKTFDGVGEYYNNDFSFFGGKLFFNNYGGDIDELEIEEIKKDGSIIYKQNDYFPSIILDKDGSLTTYNGNDDSPFYNRYFADGSYFYEYNVNGYLIKDMGYNYDIPQSVKSEFDLFNQATSEYAEYQDESSKLFYEQALKNLSDKVKSSNEKMPQALKSLV